MRSQLVWSIKNGATVLVGGESEKDFEVTGSPSIINNYDGVAAALRYRREHEYGEWLSRPTDLITAWRVITLMHNLERFISLPDNPENSTMTSLVDWIEGFDPTDEQLRCLAISFDRDIDGLDQGREEQLKRFPSASELAKMFGRLNKKSQDAQSELVRELIDSGKVEATQHLLSYLEPAEERVRTRQREVDYQDWLIKQPVQMNASLKEFLLDIGVEHVMRTIDLGHPLPMHYDMDSLDKEIMSQLVGSCATVDGIVALFASEVPPIYDSHTTIGTIAGGNDVVSLASRCFYKYSVPQVEIDGIGHSLKFVRFNFSSELLEVFLVPVDDDMDSFWLDIPTLRERTGIEYGSRVVMPTEVEGSDRRKPSWIRSLLTGRA